MQILPLNTPMSGRLTDSLSERLDMAGRPKDFIGEVDKSSKGRLYNIFNKYGLYDVDDSPYLTDAQRNSVPMEDRTVVSDYIDAIVDGMRWILLGDYLDGPMYKAQDMVEKTLIKAMSADARAQSISAGVSVIPGMQWVESASQTLASVTSLMSGLPPFHPDILPKFNMNLPKIPMELEGLLPDVYFSPDWLFISKHEYNRPILFDDSNPKKGPLIGYSIDLWKLTPETAVSVFSPFSVSSDGSVNGDLLTGVSSEQFELILEIVNKTRGTDKNVYINEQKYALLRLNKMQMLGSFIRWSELSLWSQFKNKSNYINAHWGMCTKNTCPSSIRTSIVSYTMNHGVKISSDTPFSAFVSYLLTIGMYYQNGYDFPIVLTPFMQEMVNNVTFFDGERDYKLIYRANITIPQFNSNSVKVSSKTPIIVRRIPKNVSVANKIFMLIGDIIARRSYATIDGLPTRVQRKYRTRRIEEGNLIFGDLEDGSEIQIGKLYNEQPDAQSPNALKTRGLGQLVMGTVYRYDSNSEYGTISNGASPHNHICSYGKISEGAYPNDIFLPNVGVNFPPPLQKISYWINTIVNDVEVFNESSE